MFSLIQDQLRRYVEIKQSDLPSAVAAKKTREFRCPPREQVIILTSFFISNNFLRISISGWELTVEVYNMSCLSYYH